MRATWGFLLAVVLTASLDSGCQGPDSTRPATQPAPSAIESPSTAPLAEAADHDLASLKQTWHEGLITKQEYAQARTKVVSQIALQVVVSHPRFGPKEMHDELAALARMKKDGTLTDEEYETARKAIISVFVPPNSPQLPSSGQ